MIWSIWLVLVVTVWLDSCHRPRKAEIPSKKTAGLLCLPGGCWRHSALHLCGLMNHCTGWLSPLRCHTMYFFTGLLAAFGPGMNTYCMNHLFQGNKTHTSTFSSLMLTMVAQYQRWYAPSCHVWWRGGCYDCHRRPPLTNGFLPCFPSASQYGLHDDHDTAQHDVQPGSHEARKPFRPRSTGNGFREHRPSHVTCSATFWESH